MTVQAPLGDVSCDGSGDSDNINPFVLTLSGQSVCEAAFPTCNWLYGDCNGDGYVDSADITPFVLALSNAAGYEAAYPGCDAMLADCNGDGLINFADINPLPVRDGVRGAMGTQTPAKEPETPRRWRTSAVQ